MLYISIISILIMSIGEEIKTYVIEIILGFESGLYKIIKNSSPSSLVTLKDPNQPFIEILKNVHETYYTNTFNSIVKRDDAYINNKFDKLQSYNNHSKQCLLNIISNIAIKAHFSIKRDKLNTTTYDTYMTSLENLINEQLEQYGLSNLFNHICLGPKNNELTQLAPGEKFISIDMRISNQ